MSGVPPLPLPPMATDRPIFVIGCPRSGTTLLTLMLSSHSRIAIPPETRFLLSVFRRRPQFGDLRLKENRRRLARAVLHKKGTKFRQMGLNDERVRKEIVTGPPTIGSALSVPYRLYAMDRGKARWGDKRPSYFRHIAVIRALFPRAQIVHIVRDPRDCAGSLKRMRWWRHGTVGAAATWVHAIDQASSARRSLPADAFTELRYEDLVAQPRTELERLCDFLGESFEESMLAPHLQAASLPPRQRGGWHAETQQQVGSRRVGSYVEVLTPDEIALVERAAGSRMRDFGYDGHTTHRAPPTMRLRYRKAITSMRLRTRLLALRDRRLARPRGMVEDRH